MLWTVLAQTLFMHLHKRIRSAKITSSDHAFTRTQENSGRRSHHLFHMFDSSQAVPMMLTFLLS